MKIRALVTTKEGRRLLDLCPRSVNETEHSVVDLFRQDKLALVVCIKCGETWAEGAEWVPLCPGTL